MALLVPVVFIGCASTGTSSVPDPGVAEAQVSPGSQGPTGHGDLAGPEDATGPHRPTQRLIDASDIDSVLGRRADLFSRQVALLAGDLTDAELEELVPAVRTGFAPDLLRRDVARFLEAEAPAERIEAVLAWLEDGANAEIRRTVDAYDPPVALREWLTEYTEDPPSVTRVRLVARWTEARGTGDFFVLMEQALDEAAYAVRAHFRPDAPSFQPLRNDPLLDRLENSYNAAVLTSLHRTETVPDSVLVAAVQELESDDGQWYVRSWQLAVAEAIRAAGDRVLEALGG